MNEQAVLDVLLNSGGRRLCVWLTFVSALDSLLALLFLLAQLLYGSRQRVGLLL